MSGVFQVLEHAGQLLTDLDGRARRPGAVGVEPQRQVRELDVQGADDLDVAFRGEKAALQFDGRKAVFVDHPAGLGDDAGGVERLPPFVGTAPGWPAHL